jgi:hypothetical protein
VDIIDTWANFYQLRDELRHDSSFQSSLCEPEVCGTLTNPVGSRIKLGFSKVVSYFLHILVPYSTSTDSRLCKNGSAPSYGSLLMCSRTGLHLTLGLRTLRSNLASAPRLKNLHKGFQRIHYNMLSRLCQLLTSLLITTRILNLHHLRRACHLQCNHPRQRAFQPSPTRWRPHNQT